MDKTAMSGAKKLVQNERSTEPLHFVEIIAKAFPRQFSSCILSRQQRRTACGGRGFKKCVLGKEYADKETKWTTVWKMGIRARQSRKKRRAWVALLKDPQALQRLKDVCVGRTAVVDIVARDLDMTVVQQRMGVVTNARLRVNTWRENKRVPNVMKDELVIEGVFI